jgi:hypothetical protein
MEEGGGGPSSRGGEGGEKRQRQEPGADPRWADWGPRTPLNFSIFTLYRLKFD